MIRQVSDVILLMIFYTYGSGNRDVNDCFASMLKKINSARDQIMSGCQ